MNPFLLTVLCILFLTLTLAEAGYGQRNSPWKKEPYEIVSGVYVCVGMHKYSLTLGQGFSVYLRNINRRPVVVTGKLKAITLCDSIITTTFVTKLAPGQIKAGGNMKFTEGNSQTGVVTPLDCNGITFYDPKRKRNFVNRIKQVVLEDLIVKGTTSQRNENIAKIKGGQ